MASETRKAGENKMKYKFVKAAAFAFAMGAAFAAHAGDIISIDALCDAPYSQYNGGKTYPCDGPDSNNPPLTIGEILTIRVRLVNANRGQNTDGVFPWDFNFDTGSTTFRPQLGLSVGGVLRYADLILVESTYDPTESENGYKSKYFTDLIFQYTVQPGDLAQPVKLMNSSYREATGGEGEQILLKMPGPSWKLQNMVDPLNPDDKPINAQLSYISDEELQELSLAWHLPNAAPTATPTHDEPGRPSFDKTLATAGVHIKTIDFDSEYDDASSANTSDDPWVWRTIYQHSSVAARLGKGTIVLDAPANYAGGYATMYVWSENESIIRPVGEMIAYDNGDATRNALSVTIHSGESRVPITLYAEGDEGSGAYIYMSSAPTNMWGNAGELIKNTVRRYVKVGEPMKPSVGLTFGDNSFTEVTAGSDYATAEPIELTVTLSEPFTNDVTVTVKPKLNDGDGATVDVYGKHILASSSIRNSGNGWLQQVKVLKFQKGEDTKKLYLYALGAAENTFGPQSKRAGTGIEFDIEIEEADARAYFNEVRPAVLYIDPQIPEILEIDGKDPSLGVVTNSFTQGKARDIKIAVDDGYRNMKETQDADGIAAGGTNLWRVIWYTNDDDAEYATTYERTCLVPTFENNRSYLVLKDIMYPTDGTFASEIQVFNPDGYNSRLTLVAESAKPKSVVATLDKGVYNEGEDVKVSISLSKRATIGLYAYYEPLNEAASNNVLCANLAVPGKIGKPIPARDGKVSDEDPMILQLLDGPCNPIFRIVLCESGTFDPEKVENTYNTPEVMFSVKNVEPTGASLKINSITVLDGATRSGKVPAENQIKFDLELLDVAADTRYEQWTADSYEIALKKWVRGIEDDDVAKLVNDGLLLTKWTFIPPTSSDAEPQVVIVAGSRNGSVSLKHVFPETYMGTNTVEVQALDKDMIDDLLNPNNPHPYSRAQIASWAGFEDPESNDYEESTWQTGLFDRQWGPKFTAHVVVDFKPNIQIIPGGLIHDGSITGQICDGWIYEDEEAFFDIMLSKTRAKTTEVNVTLERISETGGLTDIKALGTLSLANQNGEWLMTEDNTDESTRVAIVNVAPNSNRSSSTQTLRIIKKDGTPYSRYRITATAKDSGDDAYEAGTFVLEVVNRDPILSRVFANVGMRYSIIDGASTNAVPVSRRAPIKIDWEVKDFVTNDMPPSAELTVIWDTPSEPNSRKITTDSLSGTYETSFSASGENLTITVTIADKDCASPITHVWYFNVDASKSLVIYPIKPASTPFAGTYVNAKGVGVGSVEANGGIGEVSQFIQSWDYAIASGGARVYAHGLGAGEMDTAPTGNPRGWWVSTGGGKTTESVSAYVNPDDKYDSFVYCFMNVVTDESGNGTPAFIGGVVATVDAATSVPLPKAEKDATSYDDTSIAVVFSREWRPLDNCGDINADGVPDFVVANAEYDFGIYQNGQVSGNDLANLSGWNDDEDFLPASSTAGNGIAPGTQDKWEQNGGKFGARLEVRGFGDGLNLSREERVRKGYMNRDGSFPEPDYTANEMRAYLAWKGVATENSLKDMDDSEVETRFRTSIEAATEDLATGAWTPERPTDPTRADTDNDGLSDGYEYWFWYGAKVGY